MRAAAEIEPLALAVQGDGLVARDPLDDLGLVLLAPVAEVPHRLVAIPHLARDGLVAVDDLAHAFLHALQILGREGLLAGEVVVEPVLDGRSDGDLRLRPQLLDRLGQDVGRVVAQQLQRLLGIAGHDSDGRVGVEGGGEVAHRAVDLDRERGAGEALADARGDVGSRHRTVEVPDRAVGKRDAGHVVSVLQPMRRSPISRGGRRVRFYPAIRVGSRDGGGRRRPEYLQTSLIVRFVRRRGDDEMKRSRVTASGQTTIPKSIREAAGLYVGDVLAFETDGDHVVVRKVAGGPNDHLKGLSGTMSEWASPEDEEAWRDL